MANYIVAYDISERSESEGRAEDVRARLRQSGATHAQESVWLIESTWTALEIYQWLGAFLDMTRDCVLVAQYNQQNFWSGGPRMS